MGRKESNQTNKTSNGSEDNAGKPYFVYFKVSVWSWKLGQGHENLTNSSPPFNNVSVQV